MSSLFDKLNSEMEQFGRRAQAAFDEGKLRLEFFRLRREQDDLNRDLGRLVYRRERGREVDAAHIDSLMLKLDQLEAELLRIERALATATGETVSVSEDPQPAGARPAADAEVT
ncbi:MAG TPA: hypothetical protein VJN95_06060 [Gemmatimonadales bacterium]|nr:hypothetical protein [Gemmatimonadales bacterium]